MPVSSAARCMGLVIKKMEYRKIGINKMIAQIGAFEI
jgi:hypothetical protein